MDARRRKGCFWPSLPVYVGVSRRREGRSFAALGTVRQSAPIEIAARRFDKRFRLRSLKPAYKSGKAMTGFMDMSIFMPF